MVSRPWIPGTNRANRHAKPSSRSRCYRSGWTNWFWRNDDTVMAVFSICVEDLA
jgi:hypothetical protein